MPVGLGQAAGGIFFIVDALETKAKGYDVVVSFPKEGIGTSAEAIALIKGAKNPDSAKKLIDFATSAAMQSKLAEHKVNFVPANPEVKTDPALAEVLKGAGIFPIDDDYAGANRKRIIERWVKEVLPAHYHVIFTEGLPAIRDTLIIAAIGMPIGGLYGVLVGYLVARRRFPGRHAIELVAMINYALPGTIVGIAYLIAFNDPPIALTGGALIIIACYVFRYSPTGIRATVALLQQIDRSLEDASASLGAGTSETFRRVMLPLIAPAFFAGLGVVFIRSMTAISATIFLVSISRTLITVRILENMTELALGPAAAFSVLVIVVVFVVVGGLSAVLARLRTPAAGGAARSFLGG